MHLLLYSVFRIGNATNNVRWDTLPRIWRAAPRSRGPFRFLSAIRTADSACSAPRRSTSRISAYARDRKLELVQGMPFGKTHDAVLGADVAEALGFRLGQSIVIAHGAGDVSFSLHEDHPFRVVGILARTGTPVDRTVHVTLEGMDAVHAEHTQAACR